MRTTLLVSLSFLAIASAASCGGGGGGGPGAPTPTPTTNLVTVSDANGPRGNIDVVVSDSAGNPVAHVLTAADGTVGVGVPSGGAVAVYSEATSTLSPNISLFTDVIAEPP